MGWKAGGGGLGFSLLECFHSPSRGYSFWLWGVSACLFSLERFYLDSSELPSKQYSEAAGEGRAIPSLSYVLKITQRGEASPQSPLELPTIA